MLYKFNLQSKKSNLERVELSTLVNTKMDAIEARTKQNVSEVNIFLHQLHYDIEQYMTKHKKEHTVLNERFIKLAEDTSKLASTTIYNKDAVD